MFTANARFAMQYNPLFKSSCVAAAMLIVGVSSALAAPNDRANAEARYQRARAACVTGRSNEDQATCLKEAGAVRNEELRGIDLSEGVPDYRQNQLERCKIFIDPNDARECRMRIEQGSVSGSARDGGILRELTTTEQKGPTVIIVPAPPAAPAPVPAP
jgi:hypothetical protein